MRCAKRSVQTACSASARNSIYRRSEKKAQEAARQARELKKRKSNPVRRGAQERRRQAREERERRNEYFRQAAIQAAIERRKSREE